MRIDAPYIADSTRARNGGDAAGYDPEADAVGSYYDAIAAIGAAVRAGAPVPTTGYFGWYQRPIDGAGNAAPGDSAPHHAHGEMRPLNAYRECDILALIGHAIGPRHPIGSACRWHKKSHGIAERRLAEYVAGIVYAASGDDTLSRSMAIAAAGHAAACDPAPLPELIGGALDKAIEDIDARIAYAAGAVGAIRAVRTRAALSEISAKRKAAESEARALEREAAAIRRDVIQERRYFERDPDNPLLPKLRKVWHALLSLDVPKLERRAAAIRAAAPAYRLTSGQRRRLAEFTERMRCDRAVRSALRAAATRLIRGGRAA